MEDEGSQTVCQKKQPLTQLLKFPVSFFLKKGETSPDGKT
jgi:hypothetical protein